MLVIGGGSSHNFAKFFGDTDSATLKAAGFTVHYTEDRDQAADELANADVAIISVNRKFFDTAAYRKALFDFAAAARASSCCIPARGMALPAGPSSTQIVGGGARGHDKIHPFDVKRQGRIIPIMNGVPASFTVEDELYYMNAEPDKIPEDTARSKSSPRQSRATSSANRTRACGSPSMRRRASSASHSDMTSECMIWRRSRRSW